MAPEMNKLINKYFLTEDFEQIEHELAGSMGIEEYLPLRKIDSPSELNQLKSNIKMLIEGNPETDESTCKSSKLIIFIGYTCLEVVKILLGITSKNISFALYKNNPYFGSYKDYDHNDLATQAKQIYIDHQVRLAEIRLAKRPKL